MHCHGKSDSIAIPFNTDWGEIVERERYQELGNWYLSQFDLI